MTTETSVLPAENSTTDESLSNPKSGRKVGFVHLGCPKNLVDTENMLGLLEEDGHQIVASEQDADIVLVNTCAFIEKAQEESVEVLANLAEQGKKLLISGCLAQKFQGELLDLFPEAEAVVGTHNVPDVAKILQKTSKGERIVATQQDPTYVLEDDSVRRHVTLGAWAYIKVAEGCDYKCSFCIIPSMRGGFRSRSVENVVNNVTELVSKGVSEVIIVGQDTTSYGKDINSSLPQLLRALNDIEGLQWIRFMYAYPNLVSDELLDTIRDCDKVVKYLDCPLQHTHPEILKRMRRPVMDHVEFAKRARERVPGIKLRTAFIVGFPGETDEHFEHLKASIKEAEWDRLGIFEYSDIDTAHSKTLDGKVDLTTISKRRNELMALQQTIAFENNQKLVGQTVPVIIDEINAYGQATGRTQWDAPEVDNSVLVTDAGELVPGEIVDVTITHAGPYDVKAILA